MSFFGQLPMLENKGFRGGQREAELVKYYKHFGVSIRFKKNNWLL